MTFITTKPPKPPKPPIITEHADALRHWKKVYLGYGITHYVLVILGILAGAIITASSATAAAGQTFMSPIVSAVLGILAAVSVAITNAVDTGTKYDRYRKAWVHLNTAIMRYKTERDFLIKDVTNAYETGENVILEKTEVKKG